MDKDGYLNINLKVYNKKNKKRFRINRLVALIFIPNPKNKPQVNHKDGNKLNNNVDNLEWVTAKENIKHAFENNLRIRNGYGEKHFNSKYSDKMINEICLLMQNGKSNKYIFKKYNKVNNEKFRKLIYHLRHKESRINICKLYNYTSDPKGIKKIKIKKIK